MWMLKGCFSVPPEEQPRLSAQLPKAEPKATPPHAPPPVQSRGEQLLVWAEPEEEHVEEEEHVAPLRTQAEAAVATRPAEEAAASPDATGSVGDASPGGTPASWTQRSRARGRRTPTGSGAWGPVAWRAADAQGAANSYF